MGKAKAPIKGNTKKNVANKQQKVKVHENSSQTEENALKTTRDLDSLNKLPVPSSDEVPNVERLFKRQQILCSHIDKLTTDNDKLKQSNKEMTTKFLNFYGQFRHMMKTKILSDQQRIRRELNALNVLQQSQKSEIERNMKELSDQYEREKQKLLDVIKAKDNKLTRLRSERNDLKVQLGNAIQAFESQLRNVDVARKESYNAREEAREVEEKMRDKLFMADNQKCSHCAVSAKIQEQLTDQIAGFQFQQDKDKLEIESHTNTINHLTNKVTKQQKEMEEAKKMADYTKETYERQLKFYTDLANKANKQNAVDVMPITPGTGNIVASASLTPPEERDEMVVEQQLTNAIIHNKEQQPSNTGGQAKSAEIQRPKMVQKPQPSAKSKKRLPPKTIDKPKIEQQQDEIEIIVVKPIQKQRKATSSQNQQPKALGSTPNQQMGVKATEKRPNAAQKQILINDGLANKRISGNTSGMSVREEGELASNASSSSGDLQLTYFSEPPRKKQNSQIWSAGAGPSGQQQIQAMPKVRPVNQVQPSPNVWQRGLPPNAAPPIAPQQQTGGVYQRCQGATINDFYQNPSSGQNNRAERRINHQSQGVGLLAGGYRNVSWRSNSFGESSNQPVDEYEQMCHDQEQQRRRASMMASSERALPPMYAQQQRPASTFQAPRMRMPIPRPPERPVARADFHERVYAGTHRGGGILPWHQGFPVQQPRIPAPPAFIHPPPSTFRHY